MKEAQWLACADVAKMLEFAKKRKAPVRGARLFAAAVCRRAWADLVPRCRAAVEALEAFADGPGKQPDKNVLKAAWQAANVALADVAESSRPFWACRAACSAAEPTEAWWSSRGAAERWLDAVEATDGKGGRRREAAALADVLRDVYGTLFQKAEPEPGWVTPVVQSLALAAYDERLLPGGELDAARLAVLADALEEAGAGGVVLAHLREPRPHVRGCWVVERLTGRA